jgi:spore photoproduct lyase
MPIFVPETIFIDPMSDNDLMTSDISAKFPDIPKITLDSEQLKNHIKEFDLRLLEEYKKRIYLTRQKGKILKSCPGTKRYICCGYKILNIGDGCIYDCHFCALQDYVNKPFITIYTNIEEVKRELETEFESNPDKIYRVGTGELTDSLAIENIDNYSIELIKIFKPYKKAFLELKTKSTNIESLLKIDAPQNIIISFSMNSNIMAQKYEELAPTVKDRIQAAKICQDHGYMTGFHFDPIFYYPGWKNDYKETLNSLFENINPKRIPWISLGAFRFTSNLKKIINKRFKKNLITKGEFFPGLDDKLRYFKPIRIELFRYIYSIIKSYDSELFVYLCMESPEIWEKSLDIKISTSKELSDMIDQRIISVEK